MFYFDVKTDFWKISAVAATPIESQSSGIKHRRPQDDPATTSVFAQFVESYLCKLVCGASCCQAKVIGAEKEDHSRY